MTAELREWIHAVAVKTLADEDEAATALISELRREVVRECAEIAETEAEKCRKRAEACDLGNVYLMYASSEETAARIAAEIRAKYGLRKESEGK